jgi:hypothetical protein
MRIILTSLFIRGLETLTFPVPFIARRLSRPERQNISRVT